MIKLMVELMFITPNAEKLIETARRTSRLSFDKQRKDTEKKFIRMIIKMGHFSVLEQHMLHSEFLAYQELLHIN